MFGGELTPLLQFFPANGLDQSLHASVLVGLLFLSFFREAFGWGYAGLVVPGYLATVLLAAPLTGGLVIGESIAAYVLAAFVGQWLPKAQAWSSLFGRERFLLLIVTALFVRVAVEGYWLGWLLTHFRLGHSRELYSIGLVLVPLLANSFWNHGLRVSLPRVAVLTLLTYLVVDQVLLKHTNFTLSRFRIANESVSLAFLETPHAHIILLLGAVLAARENVRYGWDYNGILVPALLAVAWYQPTKLVTTVVEAVIVLLLARGVAKLWPFSKIMMVGPRRMLLTYLVGFWAKWGLGFAALRFAPGLQMVDYFGFGYLLPSLLAVKMWNTDKVGRVLMPTLQVSVTAFILGNLASYALRFVEPAALGEARVPVEVGSSTSLALMLADTAPNPRPEPMTLRAFGSYEQGLLLAEAIAKAAPHQAEIASPASNRLRVTSTPGGWWVVGPRAIDPNDDRVAPRFAMRPWAASRPWMVVVETSRVGAPEAVVGHKLADLLGARLVLLRSGFAIEREYDDAFRRNMAERHGIERTVLVRERDGQPTLSVVGRVPGDLSVEALASSLGVPVTVAWRAASSRNDPWGGVPRLELSRSDLERAGAKLSNSPPAELWVGSVQRALRERTRELSYVEAGAYRVPPIEELRLFGGTISRDLSTGEFPGPTPWQSGLALQLGYRFARIALSERGPSLGFALFEPTSPNRRGLPTWVAKKPRHPTATRLMLEVPAPRWESGGADAALALGDAFDVRALLMAGALPNADARGRADPRKVSGRQSYYQRAHEAWLQSGGNVIAINGIAPDQEESSHALLTFQNPADTPLGGPTWTHEPAALLVRTGLAVGAVDGSVEREAYAGEGDPAMAYARRFATDRMAMLWLSASLRSWFHSLDTKDPTLARLKRAAQRVDTGSVYERALELIDCGPHSKAGPCAQGSTGTTCDAPVVRGTFEHYRDTHNPFELRAALDAAHGCHLEFTRDEQSGRIWVILVTDDEVWLVPLGPGRRPRDEPLRLLPAEVERPVFLGLSTLRVRRAS